MTDAQWLRAMERYHDDDFRRRGRTFTDGGSEQLAGELQHAAKENPTRFAALLPLIPDSVHQSYIRRLLWGLAEADGMDIGVLSAAIVDAHARSGRPYGSGIARLFSKYSELGTNPLLIQVLVWYLERGEANDDVAVDDVSDADRELVTVEDLMHQAGRVHIRGLNNVRGVAAEAFANVLWNVPGLVSGAWELLERRAREEPLLSVRCCLMAPTVPLFNDNKDRCAALAEAISRQPRNETGKKLRLFERLWISVAFPTRQFPRIARNLMAHFAGLVSKMAVEREAGISGGKAAKWWAPLLTHSGIYLMQFILQSTPRAGERLLSLIIFYGDETSRMIGAWHVFRRSFQDDRYAPMADTLVKDGVIYRRLLAHVASEAVTVDEYRYRAEQILQAAFEDSDRPVRHQAADVFRNIKPVEFRRYRALANRFVKSRAFESESWAFFHALSEAECKVDDIVIAATEKLIGGDAGGRRHMDLHQLQDILKREYAASEADPDLRRRLLDLIDNMLRLELFGVDEIVRAHER
jgi:hypothetical protein